jgi:uncharacterized membrane protein
LLTFALQRRTVEGKRLHLAWQAFHQHLKSVSKAMGPVSLNSAEWGRYLVTAIIFGMHRKLLPKIALSEADGAVVYPAWYVAHSGGVPGEGLAGMVSGISTMVDTVTGTVSSASGTGGGASAGGGGGSGGGGGGAG